MYLQKAFHCSYSHSHFFFTSSRVSSLLSSLFHVIFPIFPPLHPSPIFFPPCISLAVTSHLPPAPSTTYTVSSTQLQLLLRGRDREGRTCSPPKHLTATNAGNGISSEDKKAIELMPFYKPLNAGKMEAEFLLSS